MTEMIEQKKRYIYACKVYNVKYRILQWFLAQIWKVKLDCMSEGDVMRLFNKLTTR